MGETLNTKNVATVQFNRSVRVFSNFPNVIVEGILADRAVSLIGRNFSDFDGGDGEEKVELSGDRLHLEYCVGRDWHFVVPTWAGMQVAPCRVLNQRLSMGSLMRTDEWNSLNGKW